MAISIRLERLALLLALLSLAALLFTQHQASPRVSASLHSTVERRDALAGAPLLAPSCAPAAPAASTVAQSPLRRLSLDGPFAPPSADAAASLGAIVVIGAGRPLGSAVVALLADLGARVRAVDDGATGFVTAVDFRVALDEVDVTMAGTLSRVLGDGADAADTVFVDLDPDALVAPCGAPLACALTATLSARARRVIFLRDDRSTLGRVLTACPESSNASAPSVALISWRGAAIVGVGTDPSIELARSPRNAFFAGLQCLVDTADALAYVSHDFDTSRVLDAFFRAAGPAGECGSAVGAALVRASTHGLHAANAAADVLTAAVALSVPASLSSESARELVIFERLDLPRGAFSPFAGASDERVLRNALPTLAAILARVNDKDINFLKSSPDDMPSGAQAAFADVAWWVWRQSVLHGFRSPEPLSSYDPSIDLGSSATTRVTVHDVASYAITHSSTVKKARWSQARRRGAGASSAAECRGRQMCPTIFCP